MGQFRRHEGDKGKDDDKGRAGGWRDREKRKMDQWGPPRDRDDRDGDKRGPRDRDSDRPGPPRRGEEGEWRRDDRTAGPRGDKDREGDRRGDRGGRRFEDRDRNVERGPPRRGGGGGGEDSWRRPEREERGPPRGGPLSTSRSLSSNRLPPLSPRRSP